jgi:hypothetical protein
MVVGRNWNEENPKKQGPDGWHSDNEFVHRVSHTPKINDGLKLLLHVGKPHRSRPLDLDVGLRL